MYGVVTTKKDLPRYNLIPRDIRYHTSGTSGGRIVVAIGGREDIIISLLLNCFSDDHCFGLNDRQWDTALFLMSEGATSVKKTPNARR